MRSFCLYSILLMICLIILIVGISSTARASDFASVENEVNLRKVLHEFETMKSKMENFEKLEMRIAQLERYTRVQQKQIESQKRQIQSLRQQLAKPRDTVSDQDPTTLTPPAVPTTADKMPENSLEITDGLQEEGPVVSRRNLRSAAGIAFTAVLGHDTSHIGIQQVIKFDHVLLNDGGCYSKYSGTFTAPVDGVYLFLYHFAHMGNVQQVWLELMVNGVKQNAGTSDPYHTYQDIQAGNSAIIRLNVNDAVWLEAYHQPDTDLYGSQGFTSFSGALLY